LAGDHLVGGQSVSANRQYALRAIALQPMKRVNCDLDQSRVISLAHRLAALAIAPFGSDVRIYDMASEEESARQILSIFMQHGVSVGGVLRRNNFIDVRDADFQRGLNQAVGNGWIKIKLRDRYTYELTEAGLAEGQKPPV
jgi:hypothetical protein